MKKIRKYIFIICLITFIFFISFYFKSVASVKKTGIDNFPDSYKPYLKILKEKYPKWEFIALYTNLDWNDVINQENVFGKNLVPQNYSDNWKNTNPDQYNIEVDKGWVDSSRRALEYCMDPRNFLNEVRIFQFEELSYNYSTNNINSIEKILYGTEFYNKKVSYIDSNKNTIHTNEKYSDLILRAAKKSGVSSYHLASRIKQEVGPFLTHSSISGTVEGFEGLYNFYNIGATSSSEEMGAIKNGLQFAKDGNGLNLELRNKYMIPWNSKEKAITGGAVFIGSSYINQGQNTIYLQKFDVNNENKSDLFWHQYMTNVLAPYSESKSIYNGYQKIGMLSSNMSFIIPVFENMSDIPADNPNINLEDFSEDNTKVYCTATNVNIRTGPDTSYDVITTISNPYNMTRIKKGNQIGERWDKIILQNGIIGYIYQNYVKELPEINIKFQAPLKVNNFQISGLENNKNLVSYIKSKLECNFTIEIVDNKNQILNDNDTIGSGCKIRIRDSNNIIKEYEIILYGDTNGDGKIDSVDLLVLQRHILEIEPIKEIYKIASNVRKNGKEPSSIDLLLIQQHILELREIEQ